MPSHQLSDSLVQLFRDTTASSDSNPDTRAILVQTGPTGKSLELTESLPPSSTDKEDYEPLLGKLFGKEPNRSGYALYRLDTQAANGDWEWLCIAYQPESAKVKEKMQYVATRTSLLSGLDEKHFLETLYATGPGDFRFPTKLRNARKHDYQNPQLKTAGKPAAEAAGTDAGGARRNFGAATRAAATPAIQPAASSTSESKQAPPVKASDEQPAATPAVKAQSASSPAETNSSSAPPASQASTAPTSDAKDQAIVENVSQATSSFTPLEAVKKAASAASPKDEKKDAMSGSIAPSANGLPAADTETVQQVRAEARQEALPEAGLPSASEEPAPISASSTSAAPDAVDAKASAAEESVVSEEALDEAKAPEEPPTRADIAPEASEEKLSQPQVPSAETARKQLGEPEAPISKPKSQEQLNELPQRAAEKKTSSTASSASAAPAAAKGSGSQSDSHGNGNSSSGAASSSSSKTLEWSAEAEVAISGLASRPSGPSEHNFVSLILVTSTASAHRIDLQGPPRFVPPGDLTPAVESEIKDKEADVAFVVYRYPVEVQDKKQAYLYSQAPFKGSASLKNLYVSSLDQVEKKVSDLSNLTIYRESLEASYGPYPRPTAEQAEEVTSRILDIRRQIEEAAQKADRSSTPRLVAVSKLHPPSSILAAHVHAQQVHFGENYVQEMVDKAKVLPPTIKWHFVGGLQSNKGKLLASIPNLYLLETLDSIKAANVLEKALASEEAVQREEALRVYLQVNTSGEEVKSGLPPLSDEGGEESLLELAKHVIEKCPHLQLQGLMTIGSADNSKSSTSGDKISKAEALQANPDFERLHTSRTILVQKLRQAQTQSSSQNDTYTSLLQGTEEDGSLELSMGMTADFPIAIAAGSDNVRIGTACFGQRPGSREEAKKGMEEELKIDVGKNEGGASATGWVGEKGFGKPRRPGGNGKRET